MTTRTITLTLTVTEAEANALINRFTSQANAVTDGSAPVADLDTEDGPVDPNAGTVDVKGVPWHADHHAATKGKNQDGTWKAKKGHDKAALAAYEAQFAATGALATPAPAPAEPAPVPSFLQTGSFAPTMPSAPAMPVAPVPVAPFTYSNLIDAFGAFQTRTGAAISGEQLGWVYQTAQLPLKDGQWDTDALNNDEALRRRVADALSKIGG